MPTKTAVSAPEILSPATEHVVILGGGFAGRYAARHLAGILPIQHRITLVDRVDHMLYTPMLTEVAGGTVEPESVAVPAAKLPRRVRHVQAEIEAVDAHTKSVTLQSGEVLHATQLVLALGSAATYHQIPGARENSLALKTLADANTIRVRLDHLIADAASARDGREISLVVAGGGYTGVESIAALHERMQAQARQHGLPSGQLRATLVESLPRLMQEMPEPLARYTDEQLQRSGIRVLLGVNVKSVEPGVVKLSTGENLTASLLLWDAGIEPSPLLEQIDVPKGKHHGVVVDAMFRVQEREGVWAIGDCAEIPMPEGGTYATTAQNATREGVQVARNIVAVLKHRPLHPFRFRMLGQLALIAKKNAVAEILGVQLRGFITWTLWWIIYIAKLPDNSLRMDVVRALLRPSEPQRSSTVERAQIAPSS